MPVGKVTSIEPGSGSVDVRFEVPADLDLPADVQVMLMAPNLISDRYLELYPPYKTGAKLTGSAQIPVERTAVPLAADEIIKSVTELSEALGPNGANKDGDLSNLFASLATSFGPDGKPLNDTITNFGQALGALGAQGTDLTRLLDSLGSLTTTASQNVASYTSFANGLASVSTTLAAEKGDIATALATLQQALTQLSTFVSDNAATLSGSVDGLNTFAASLTRQQAALSETFRTLPLALQNLDSAVDRTDPADPSLKVRFDPAQSSAAFGTSVCGNSVLRLLTLSLADKNQGTYDGKSAQDLVCGFNGVVSQLPAAPGGSSPDLGALLAGRP
jgi:phospholipid/cholesterol/gamma-HCH transport system substrate-binding protein